MPCSEEYGTLEKFPCFIVFNFYLFPQRFYRFLFLIWVFIGAVNHNALLGFFFFCFVFINTYHCQHRQTAPGLIKVEEMQALLQPRMFSVYLLLLNLNLLFNKDGKEMLLFSHKIVPGNEFVVIRFHLGSSGQSTYWTSAIITAVVILHVAPEWELGSMGIPWRWHSMSSGLLSACTPLLLLEGMLSSFLAHWVLCCGCL